MPEISKVLRVVARFVFFFVTNCYGLFAYLMWHLIVLPLRFLYPPAYWKFESFIFKGLQSFVILWMGRGDYSVVEAGDDIRKLSEDPTILLINHQSTADTPLVMLSLWPKGSIMNNSYWIMDAIFRFTNFGLISIIRKDFFIRQGRETRDLVAKELASHLKENFLPHDRRWIVLFPEGGFLRKRIETSHRYAKKNGYPLLYNVTLPRTGALKTIMDTVLQPENSSSKEGSGSASEPLKWIVDMTMAYCNSTNVPPDMFGMCMGYREPQKMYVHYRAYPMSSVPRDSDGLLQWLYKLYEEKEQLLQHFKEHGAFPPSTQERSQLVSSLSPREVTYDWLSLGLYQAFYLLSAYLHYTCVLTPILSLFF